MTFLIMHSNQNLVFVYLRIISTMYQNLTKFLNALNQTYF